MMRDRTALVTTTSFRTSPARRGRASAVHDRVEHAALLVLVLVVEDALRASGRARGASISVRKPRLPKFTPSTGTPAARSVAHARGACRRRPGPRARRRASPPPGPRPRRSPRPTAAPASAAVRLSTHARRPRSRSQPTRSRRPRPASARSGRARCRWSSWRSTAVASSRRSSARRARRPRATRWRKNSRLPSAPVIGEAQAPRTA